MAGAPRSTTPEQEDLIRGMAARGESFRAIAEVVGVSAATVSRIVSPPEGRKAQGVATARGFAEGRRARPQLPPPSAPPNDDAVPKKAKEPEEPITVSEDPRELQREDWLYYEHLKVRLRRRADAELEQGNVKGHKLLLDAARAAEERAAKLRPPAPPDPERDPTYQNEARRLTTLLEHLVAAVERGEPVPARELDPTEPIAPAA